MMEDGGAAGRRALLLGLGATAAGLALSPIDALALLKARITAKPAVTTKATLPGPPTPRPPVVARAAAKTNVSPLPSRRLALFNIHTLESFDAIYWRNGSYDPKALKKLNVFLRDHYANQVGRIDPRVFDVLYSVQTTLHARGPFRVISGYRSPGTNAALRAESGSVALHSYHMKGMAIDVALPDRRVAAIAQCANAMRCGGVGMYRASGFVHLDVGPVRTWQA